ncbi:oleate hydratase [Catenaria anguillulae PL171]|uniref:Oleate hydratase n=1 Tax=Catenaria anguillulae PL171 TaxID=765915 RepID=A0A1Y2HIV4_9FUNG|nr:oleate hydratase [Catenaria anguillulae PL171]
MISRTLLRTYTNSVHPSNDAARPDRDPATTKAWMIGSGIGCLASAAELIRQAGVPASNITIFEELAVHGGSLDGSHDKNKKGYVIRGGRMLNCSYLCTYDLFDWVPALVQGKTRMDGVTPIKSVRDEIIDFNERIKTCAKARLVDIEGNKVDRINECFDEHFFTTTFWYMWATTFAFQPWHSAIEFKRYLHRFAHEFPRIETLEGVDRTVYNQYDSLVLPLTTHLANLGVKFVTSTRVETLDFDRSNPHVMTVKALNLVDVQTGAQRVQEIDPANDLVFFTNGSMTSSATLGDLDTPATSSQMDVFTAWSGNAPGTGALVTFKDSKWFMSFVVAKQPHYIQQKEGEYVFWAYGLNNDVEGDYVKKAMRDCTGREMMQELMGHLEKPFKSINETTQVIPCMMPYITSMFMTRRHEDRPPVVPKLSTNLAFVSQFAEIQDDVVFTVEYSIRAAMMAVCEFMKLGKQPPAIYKASNTPAFIFKSVSSFMS